MSSRSERAPAAERPPRPAFESYRLHPRVAAGVARAGFDVPTPIQARALPPALEGRDVLGLAQTGTGKTAAFALPILHRLFDGPRRRTRALVVAPTRELAEQIRTEFERLGASTDLRVASVYGGVGKAPQIQALRGGVEIIVACPGRLLDLLSDGHGDLSRVETLVLDEADHMFDMGFLPDVRRIVRQVPRDAQRLLFSATMPHDLRGLASEVLHDPVEIEIARDAPAATITHKLVPVKKDDRQALLEKMLKERDVRSALVFTRTKHGAKRLAEKLDRGNFFVASLQGNLSQNRRKKALDAFRKGDVHVLVATDIAARGIDVPRVRHVINFDVPDTPEAYTHRIGRTGRAERDGEAFTFMTPEDAKQVRDIERHLGTRIERHVEDGFGLSSQELALFEPNARGGGSSGGSGSGRGRSGGRRASGGGSGGRSADGRSSGGSGGGGGRAGGTGSGTGSDGRGSRRGGRGRRGGGGSSGRS